MPDSCLAAYLKLCLLRINEAERRMTIPFTTYTFAILKAKLAEPIPPLSNIEANAVVVNKIMGVNNKNTKPATILLLKLF